MGNDWAGGGDKRKDSKPNRQEDSKPSWGQDKQGSRWQGGSGGASGGDKWKDTKDDRGVRGSDWKKDDWKKDGDADKGWDRDSIVSTNKLYVKNLPEDMKEDAVE